MTAMITIQAGIKIQVTGSAVRLEVGQLHTLRGMRSLDGTSNPESTVGAHQMRSLGTQTRHGRRSDLRAGKKSAKDRGLELVLFANPRLLAECLTSLTVPLSADI